MSAAVVKLPTAAPRKVNNGRWAQQRRAGIALREQQGVFDFPPHPDREAVIKAERLADFMEARTMTPEMTVILGLLRLLDREQLPALVESVMSNPEALTLVELARADFTTRHLVWVVMQRRGVV